MPRTSGYEPKWEKTHVGEETRKLGIQTGRAQRKGLLDQREESPEERSFDWKKVDETVLRIWWQGTPPGFKEERNPIADERFAYRRIS